MYLCISPLDYRTKDCGFTEKKHSEECIYKLVSCHTHHCNTELNFKIFTPINPQHIFRIFSIFVLYVSIGFYSAKKPVTNPNGAQFIHYVFSREYVLYIVHRLWFQEYYRVLWNLMFSIVLCGCICTTLFKICKH